MLNFLPRINSIRFQSSSSLDRQVKTAGLKISFTGDSINFESKVYEKLKKENNPAAVEIANFWEYIEENPKKCSKIVDEMIKEPNNVDKVIQFIFKDDMFKSKCHPYGDKCIELALRNSQPKIAKKIIDLAKKLPPEETEKFILSENIGEYPIFKDIITYNYPVIGSNPGVAEYFITDYLMLLDDKKINKKDIYKKFVTYKDKYEETYAEIALRWEQPDVTLKLSELLDSDEDKKDFASTVCEFFKAKGMDQYKGKGWAIAGLLNFAKDFVPDKVTELKIPDYIKNIGSQEKPQYSVVE